jgi:hypothetical protein
MKLKTRLQRVGEKVWTKKFWNKQKSSQVFWIHRKERNNADKLLRLEDVKSQRILIMKNQIDVY